MVKVFKRSLIGLVAGVLTGAVLGILVGCGIAAADYLANPPQGEDFGFAFTAAAFSVIGAIAGTWTGLATGLINRRWGGIGVGAIVGFLSGFTWYAPAAWTLSAALRLAIPGSLIGAVTGIVVFQVIAPVGNKH